MDNKEKERTSPRSFALKDDTWEAFQQIKESSNLKTDEVFRFLLNAYKNNERLRDHINKVTNRTNIPTAEYERLKNVEVEKMEEKKRKEEVEKFLDLNNFE